MDILAELQARGLFADCTDTPALAARLATGPITLYCGFDPTADSLHVGNLVPLLALRRFQLAGHHPIALAGGATGMVGDPSGKSAERNLLSRDQVLANIASIKAQLSRFLDFETRLNPARLVDNADWLGPIRYLDFLREVGKHFTVNWMIAKEAVRARMEAGYRAFNASLGESLRFALPGPADAATMRGWIDALPVEANSGDVYASLTPRALARQWRIAFIVIAILAAVITPPPIRST
jgi:tyrosyl-tRNA synthetase